MKALMQNVVDTIARVLHAKASSLYLLDEATNRIMIQAATGYQKVLVDKLASYELGEGITGTIAKKGVVVRANSLDELHHTPGWAGKQNIEQGREPNSFLGVPLKVVDSITERENVIGVLKVEDIRASQDHPEERFTDQDLVLVTMMANVIATVIQSTRAGEQRVGAILKQLGTLSDPQNDVVPQLLGDAARNKDLGVLDQLAVAIATKLNSDAGRTEAEEHALFDAKANSAIYARIASWTKNNTVRWEFMLLQAILASATELNRSWPQIDQLAEPWRALKRNAADPAQFAEASQRLIRDLATAVQAETMAPVHDANDVWYGAVINTQHIFGESQQIRQLPLLFQRQGDLNRDNIERLLNLVRQGYKGTYSIAVIITWNFDVTKQHIEEMRKQARSQAVDIVVTSPQEFMAILASAHATDDFRALVLRQATYVPPFVIVGAVPDAMFFGRDRELSQIIKYVGAGHSCAIIGGRRIGKSSILRRLHRVLLPEAGFLTVYHDCATTQSLEQFMAAELLEWRPKPPPNAPHTLSELLDHFQSDKAIVLLFDEADKLIEPDRNAKWRLFNKLRAFAGSGRGQVVVVGERTLRGALSGHHGPLFNFVNRLVLGPLDAPDVEALVTVPMKQLDIELVDERAIVRQIYGYTAGHPNIVQRLCFRLIGLLNRTKKRQLTVQDVGTVIADPDFIRTDFLETYFESSTLLEQLCALLMAHDQALYTLQDVHAALTKKKVEVRLNQVSGALERLVELRSILRRTPDGYEFAVEAFPSVIAHSKQVEDWIALRRELYNLLGDTSQDDIPDNLRADPW